MDEAELELVKDWLTRAHQDLRAALILAAAEDAPLDVAIYHCQQAGEKAIKAYLQWRDEPFAKTHNHRALVIQAAALDKRFDALEKPAEILTVRPPWNRDCQISWPKAFSHHEHRRGNQSRRWQAVN